MTTVNSFKNLIGKLKREEVKSLLKFLKYYQDITDDSKGKSILLVESVLNDPECTARDLQYLLYGEENYHAFNKLLNRTKEKIYEVLLFDQNLAKPYYSERNRIVFDIRKKLVQSEILYLRGMTDDLEGFQNKIIAKAKEYEIYDSLLEALQAKQRFVGFRFGKKAFDKIESEILKFEDFRRSAQRARSLFTKIASKINESSSHLEYKTDLDEAIKIMTADYQKTQSPTIGYYLFLLTTEQLHNQNKYDAAEEILKKLLLLVQSSPSIFTKARYGDVYLNLSTNEIYLGDFNSAIQSILEAKKYYDINSVTLDVAKEIEFFARYYNGEMDESEKIISEIYNSSRKSNTPFLFSKRAYLFACLLTQTGRIKDSNELLNDVREIEKDKEGWNLGKRVLTIINRIEERDFESVDLKVLSLEKFIKRILKTRYVRKRDVIILRLLIKLINEGFDFKKVYDQRKKYFALLESDDSDYCWRIKSPELIVFHTWFKRKI